MLFDMAPSKSDIRLPYLTNLTSSNVNLPKPSNLESCKTTLHKPNAGCIALCIHLVQDP